MNRRDFLERASALAGVVRFSRVQPALKSRLILLGTAGGPTPKRTRAAPAQIIVVGDRGYLVDCGNGVARQMQLAGVFGTLRHVFVTHHHSDHDADLGNVILLDWGTNLTTAVDVWGPPPVTRMMNLFFEMNQADLDVRVRDEGRPPLPPLVHTHEITRDGIVMKDERAIVTCAAVPHPLVPLAFAYRFDCVDRSIVISGDTAPSDAIVTLARGADVLVHEALYVPKAPGEPGSALRKHIMDSHSPVEDVGRIASAAGVKTLVLSHLVPGETDAVSDKEWLAGARVHFSGRVIVGHDLMEL
ncbi:MAG TPA: MBL fold metallo-hydrolase [Vicinamibacterales bacterium]|nr:MBL fold metallo-hydrolase [Vicinamibacterales bacterium]